MAYISPTNKRFLIAYLLLVGLPLLGLAGVLRAGHTLTAPLSADGEWKWAIDSGDVGFQPCAKAIASLRDSAMVISQSGREFVMNFDGGSGARGSGTIDGTALQAAISLPQSGEAECGSKGMIALAATIDPHEPRSMQGTFSIDGCSSCTPVKYHAIKQARARKTEAH